MSAPGPHTLSVHAAISRLARELLDAERERVGARAASSEESTTPEAQTTGRSVLIVDDDADLLPAAAAWLGANGYAVETVTSGEAAVARLDARSFDAVLLDLLMPGMSGWDVYDWLSLRQPHTRIVIWTATGLRTGAVGSAVVVGKDATPQKLVDVLDGFFAGDRAAA